MNNSIMWFRNDLRLADNKALDYINNAKMLVIFVYIMDPKLNIGRASSFFLHNALQSLSKDLANKYNAKLVIKIGDPCAVLNNLVKQYNISNIVWNRMYEPYIISRDKKIKSYFCRHGINVKTFNSYLLFEPGKIINNAGNYFKVFTPFWRKCLANISDISNCVARPKSFNLLTVSNIEKLSLDDLKLINSQYFYISDWQDKYDFSELNANTILQNFIKEKIHSYDKCRDYPGISGTSFLSAYLHYGVVGPKQIYNQVKQERDSNGKKVFLSQIGWREFAYNLLYHFPELPDCNFQSKFDNMPWRNDIINISNWQQGNTGIPIVDAGMKQLWQTGWMHNRVRMLVASFLTKNLLIDWRIGKAWFDDCLLDADLAINSASWQWVAGSGPDYSPYFRVFNPILQSKKFDYYGNYIRTWLPQLSCLDNKNIHAPASKKDYCSPIVDIVKSRNIAIQVYKNNVTS